MAKRTNTDRSGGDDLYLEPQNDLNKDLDPHLQELVLARRAGQKLDSSIVSDEGGTMKVDVLAKLRDPGMAVPGLEVTRTLDNIVTGAVEIDRIEEVRQNPNIVSLKAATELHLDLQFSVPEINCAAAGLQSAFPQISGGLTGEGAIVGVVDFGCDFQHKNFRDPSEGTRLLFLWDQRGGPTSISPAGFGYGREFTRADIDNALQQTNPYQALAYEPDPESHGTHVLDIAAGNGRRTGTPGVAPRADLIFVEVAASDFGAEESFGNSRRLLEAVDYVFTKAEALGRPAVVNLSLGTHGGPHDGSTLVEQGFESLLNKPGRAIVISAGNSFDNNGHALGSVSSAAPRSLSWQISTGDNTNNEMEVWYGGSRRLEVTLVTPSGSRLGPVALGQTQDIKNGQGTRVGRIIHRHNDPNNGDNQIDILLDRTLSKGLWKVELTTSETAPIPFHAWIERDDFGQSTFGPSDVVPSHTLGSISCGPRTLVVGSYNARVPQRDLSLFSAEGPTRDGRQKPEISAPGQGIKAANALGNTVSMSGTSMAAPHVAGLVALLFQAAGRMLTVGEIRRAVMDIARRNPPGGSGWHPRYGMGRIDGVAALRGFVETGAGTALVQALPAAAAGNGNGHPDALSQLLASIVAGAGGARVRVAIEVEPPGR